MLGTLHITSGDCAGQLLSETEIAGEIFVWHDVLYEGPRKAAGRPDIDILNARADFLSDFTGGGLTTDRVLGTLKHQYEKLVSATNYDNISLWFDACLFDQSMLAHILACLKELDITNVELLCVDEFPGIEPYNGLGELTPEQLASVYDSRTLVTTEQFAYAKIVDQAFAIQDMDAFIELSNQADAPLPWVPAAVTRWLQEQPDSKTGLGRLHTLALAAIKNGNDSPVSIFETVAQTDSKPQYWGDTTLWAKINELADRDLVQITGPTPKLPQWPGQGDLNEFSII